MIKFRVNGIPAPQGSKRHVGNGRMVESSKAVGPWREAVRSEAQKAMEPIGDWRPPGWEEAPVSVTIVFVFARPKSHRTSKGALTKRAPAYPIARRRNDIDKLARATLDALTDGGVLGDDSQVTSLNCAKVYASNGEAPGALIEVEAMA